MADEIGRTATPRGERKALAAYLRLTVDRQGNKIGYDVQKRAINRWAEYAGETIGYWYQDKDLTAADLSVERPAYEEMLRAVKAGDWGGIVVWRLDRLVRLMYEIERCLHLVDESKAFIVSIDPTVIDSRDPLGKMFMRILIMFAEMEIMGMRARQKGHKLEKAMAGKYHGGHRPFGFEGAIHDDEGKMLNSGTAGIEHNPTEAALIREAARRILDGETPAEIVADWLSRNPPVTGPLGGPMNSTVLRKVLLSPRVAGYREYVIKDPETGAERVELAPAQWKAIISPDDWQRIRTITKVGTRRGRPAGYLLTGGLVLCGECGQRMIGGRQYSRKREACHYYRCETGPTAAHRGSCGRNSIRAEAVDEMVLAAVMKRIARTPAILDAVDRDIQDSGSDIAQTSMEIVAECDRKLEEYAAMAALPANRGGLTRGEWMALRGGILEERQSALRRLEASRTARPAPVPMGRDRQDLRGWLKGLTLEQRRAFLRAHVRAVTIGRGRQGGVPSVQLDRVDILFADAQVFDAGSDQASVRDLHADALPAANRV